MKYKVGILCAGDIEVAPFIPFISDCKLSEKAMLKFYEGKIENVDIVTLFSGVCKVNAAIATQILIDNYDCNIIINSGTSGGMDKSLHILDTVVSTECAYWDVASDVLTGFHPWMESIYFKANEQLISLVRHIASCNNCYNIVFGRMITGELFIVDEKRDEINKSFHPLSVDMETASIAHVCYVNKIPYIAIRTITDTADNSGVDTFEDNCEKASQISADIVRELLKELA